jgi:hypothetical protein
MISKESTRATLRTAQLATLAAAWMLTSNACVAAAQAGGDAPRPAQPVATAHAQPSPAPAPRPGQPQATGADVAAADPAGGKQGDAADDSEKALDAESFPLLRRGIVVGAGIGAHAVSIGGIALKDAATTPMAYLGYMFQYWSPKYDETNAFCASFETASGSARADAVAIARTAATDRKDPARKAEADALAKKKPGDIFTRYELERIQKVRNWEVGRPASCELRRLGLFVGLPGKFSAEVAPRSGGASAVSEVTPLVTAGLIVSPKSYVQLLVGLTISNVAQTASSGDPEMSRTTHEQMYSLFLGVGTTFDVIGKLFK